MLLNVLFGQIYNTIMQINTGIDVKKLSLKNWGGDNWLVKFSMHIASFTLNVAMHSIMQVWELIWGMVPNLKHHPICRMAYMGL